MSQDMATWAKISAKLYLNDKVQMLADESPRAAFLWVNAITYCVDRRTDGRFTEYAAARHLNAHHDDLNLLHERGFIEPETVDGVAGWRIHDFLDAQRSNEEIEDISAKRRESGRRGAEKRWGKKRADDSSNSKPMANAMANAWQTDGKQDGKPIADTDTDTDTDTEINNPCCCSLNDSNNARAVSEENNNNDDDSPQPSETTIPPDWKPDPEDARYAMLWRLDPRKTGRAFRDYHLRHGTKSHDWHATFRGWVQRNPEAKQPPDSS